MKKQRLPLLTIVTLLFGVIVPAAAAAPPAPAPSRTTGQRAGAITALLPIAHIVRGVGQARVTTDAKKGDEVIWNDLVRTERGGRARITLTDQSILSLGSQADLRIVKHDARNQQTALEMTYGRVRAEVSRVTRQGGSFELRTPTAVAGVIGTDFGVESTVAGGSMFVCISGLVQVSNSDPNIAGSVQCAPGMTTTVTPGKAPTPPTNATPAQIQQLIQDTEPAIITAMSAVSALPGATVQATMTGTKMGNVQSATADGSGITASLVGVTDTSATVSIVVAQNAAPGPRTIHLSKKSGADSAAVFTILSPPTSAVAGPDQKKAYLDLIAQEGQTAIGGLSAYLATVQQSAGLALQQLQQANTTNADLSGVTQQFNAQIAEVQQAIAAATLQVNQAATTAQNSFGSQFDAAYQALLQRNAAGTADDAFNQAVGSAIRAATSTLAQTLNDIRGNLDSTLTTANDTIAQEQQTAMASLVAAGAKPCDPGQICPKVNSVERNIDVGAALGGPGVQSLDASSSSASAGGTIVSYRWMLCDPTYKPANVGQAMAGNNAPVCNAVPGYQSSSSEFQFPTCNLAPNDYIARLTITDSNNKSAAMDVRLHILAGAYDDPATVVRDLAQAYSTLQLTTFLNYFDQTAFTGFTQLSENYRNTLTTLASMSINPRVSQAQISCNDATVRADWVQNYSTKTNPTVTFSQSEQLSMRMTRTPGKGWLIVDFQGDNGTVQSAGQLPGPIATDAATPDLAVISVFPGSSATQTVVGPGAAQAFTAVIQNVGSAAFTANTNVVFQLLDGSNNPLAGAQATVALPVPLAAGAQVTVQGSFTVPALAPNTPVNIQATVNPGNTAAESNFGNDTTTEGLTIGGGDLQVTSAYMTSLGAPTASAIPVAAGAYPFTATVKNAGTSDFVGTTVVRFSVSSTAATPVDVPLGVTSLAPGATVTVQGTVLVPNVPGTQLTLSANVNPGCLAPETNCVNDPNQTFTQILAVNALITQITTPAIQAGSSTAVPLTVSTFGPAKLTLALPSGMSADKALAQTLTAAGTFTWNLTADLTVPNTSAVIVTADNGVPVALPIQYSLLPPAFKEVSQPGLTAGGASGTLSGTVNVPGTYTLVLPPGISTTSSLTQVITSPASQSLSWDISSNYTAATGTGLTANITAGVYTLPATYSNTGAADYVINSTDITFAGHTAPFTGANALQVGETTSLLVTVHNNGNATSTTSITLTASCSPPNPQVDTVSCTGGNNPTVTVTPPAAGASTTYTLPLGSNNNMVPNTNFTGTVDLLIGTATTPATLQTINFDVVDFLVTVVNPLSPQYLLPNSSQNVAVAVRILGGTPAFAVPVALSFGSTATPGVTFSPTSANVTGTQTFSVSAASTTAPGGMAVLATGTNRGVSRPTAQAFLVISPQLVPTQIFVNDSSNPLVVPVGSTTAQTVPFEITGSAFGGAATIVLPTVTGFAINTDATAGAVYSSPFNVTLTANSASTAAVPMTITAQLPNTSPVLSITKTLYIQGSGQPDLAVTLATPNVTLSSSSPWIDGQGVDWSVTVQNVGNAPTAGGEQVDVELNGVPVGTGTLSATPMATGASQTITVHAVAPDIHGNTPFGPSTVNGRVHVHPEQAGEPNYANNSLVISPTMANWHIAVNGSGSEASPLQVTTITAGGSATAYFTGTVDGSNIGSYTSLTFVESTGQSSAAFTIGGFTTSCGANAPANTLFCATISTPSSTLQPGIYYAQALVSLTDSITGQKTVRQATVAVQVNSGSQTAIACLTSSANNILSQNSSCATSAATTLEINGGLPVQYSVTPTLLCQQPTGGYAPCTSGQVDLAVQDAANTTTTTPSGSTAASGVSMGQQVVLRVAAIMDANGNVTTGSMPYTIGINGIQASVKRGSAAAPDPIGSKVNLAVQVGDLQISASNVTSANGAFCGGVAPGGPGLAVGITFSPLSGFNAGYSWQWEDTNHSPVGGSPFSFSTSGGSGSPSSASTTVTAAAPVNGLVRYFLAVTASDPNSPTSTGTKYYPFFFDGSTAQNYCGAISGARGRSSIPGTWNRSAADSLGPISGIALSAVNQKPATSAAAVDVHLVASDISFTPSIPKAGDTLQVRFRARNDGTADAVHIPIGLQVNGTIVAIDTFDIPAGHSSLGGLSWTLPATEAQTTAADGVRTRARGRMIDAEAPVGRAGLAGLTQLQAALMVDPNHTTTQATAIDKVAPLARLSVRPAATDVAAMPTHGQRVLLELEDGACAGLRLSTGGFMPCGSADLEITIADLAKSQLGLDTMAGVSDIGSSFEVAAGRAANYTEQLAGLSGHAYSVRLPNGGMATVTIESVRNPGELDAKARALFRAGAVRILNNLGGSSGAAAPGELTGVDNRATVFITLNVKQN